MTGWIRDPAAVDAATERLAEAGPVLVADVPGLSGYAQQQIRAGVECVLAFDGEIQTFGEIRPVKGQLRGTCVEQSGTYALTASWSSELALDRVVGVPKIIPVGPLYAMVCRHSRGQYGKTHRFGCNCGGCPDGLVVAHYAETAATVGVVPEGTYGGITISGDNEENAIRWRNDGIPPEVLEAARQVQVSAFRPKTPEELADCHFAQYWGHQGCGYTFDGLSGPFPEMRSLGGSGHAEANAGVYINEAGELSFVRRNSWFGRPKGPYTIRTRSGRKIVLPPGAYPVSSRQMAKVMSDGETWVYRVKNGWRK